MAINPFKLLFFCGTFLWALFTYGQSIEVKTQLFNEEDGLSSYVNFIHKDRRDILWVGSQFGLYRFDGQEFVRFNEESGLPFRQVMEIYEDQDGWFWLFKSCLHKPSCKRDLAFFHPLTQEVKTLQQRFGENIPVQASQILSIAQDSSGIYFTADQKFFIFSRDGGIQETAIQGLSATPYLFAKFNEGLFGIIEKRKLKFNPNTGELNEPLEYLILNLQGETKRKTIPLEHIKYGAIFMKPLGFDYDRFRIDNIELAFALDGNLTIDTLNFGGQCCQEAWMAHDFDHNLFMDKKGRYFHKNIGEIASIEAAYINSIELDLKQKKFRSKVWAAKKHEQSNKFVFQQKNHTERQFFFDAKTNTAWVAKSDGLLSLRFKTRFFEQMFNSETINLLSRFALPVGKHRILLNAAKKNAIYDHQIRSITYLDKRSGIRAFCKTPTDSFLIGTVPGSLSQINIDGSVRAAYPCNGLDKIKVYDSQVMGDQVFFGGDTGLYLFEPIAGRVQKLPPTKGFEQLDSTQIHFIEKLSEEQLYIGTQSGLYLYDIKKGVKQHLGQKGKERYFLPANRFFEISRVKAGGYWLATMNGLIHWTPQKESEHFKHYSTSNGLATNEILAAFEDGFGFVWMPTPHGLMQFQESTGLAKVYLQSDGLTHSSFQEHTHARMPDGTLVLGTYNGFNIFHPRDFKDVDLSPQVPLAIHAFEQHSDENDRIENRLNQIIENGEIILHPGDKLFNIHVALTDYREADKHRFAYLIIGYQEEWQEGRSNLIRISGLPYGKYVLKIKGQLHDGLEYVLKSKRGFLKN